MNHEELILEKEGGIATLTLNRPEQLNAFTPQMEQSIAKILDSVDKDESLKVLIVTGAGRAFCSGLDLTTLSQGTERYQKQMSESMLGLTLPIYNLSKPTIAAINGVAAGGGFSIAMLCDIRIASEKAKFSVLHIRRGLVPDIGVTYLLPRIVGTAKAMELMITGDTIDAAEALRIGIVNRVVPDEDLMTVARELADRIAKGPSVAIELTKQGVRSSITNSLEQQVEWESFAQYVCFHTEDYKEGVKSFFEKRPPLFKGR